MKRLSYPVAAALYPEAPVQIGQAAHPMSLSLSEITPKAIQQRKYTGHVRLKASLQIRYLPKTVTFTLFFNILGRVLPDNHEPPRPSPQLLTVLKRFLSFVPQMSCRFNALQKTDLCKQKPSINSKSSLKSTKTLSLKKNTSPSCLNTVGFILGFMDDNSVSKYRTG